jgi:predicted GNAT family N-acyltransferase
MNSSLEISSPLSLIETGNNEVVISARSLDLPQSTDSRNKLFTKVLVNSSRLQEIYDLRLAVWEDSGKNEFVNRALFPNGWYDELDETAIHWITVNNQNKIVASARLNLFHSIEEFPYYSSIRYLAFPTGPFAFFSRLVVHPQYRHNSLSKQLYDGRTQFCRERKITWSQVFINNPYVISLFEAEGFKNIGQAEVSYHVSCRPHAVNVFIKENKYRPL